MPNATVGEKFRALLGCGRVANLPTVWSNVLVAFWIGSGNSHWMGAELDVWLILLGFPMLIGSLIYVGGCLLGDWRDINFDREHRPNRPLPLGILSPTFVALLGWGLIGIALLIGCVGTPIAVLIIFFEGAPSMGFRDTIQTLAQIIQMHEVILTGILALLVIAYAFLHKKNAAIALILMSSCRMMLVLTAFGFVHKSYHFDYTDALIADFSWLSLSAVLVAAAVGMHTLLLSWVASTESSKDDFVARKILGTLYIMLPLVSFLLVKTTQDEWAWPVHSKYDVLEDGYAIAMYITMLVLFITWISFAMRALKNSKPQFVSMALAGFCLLDACFAATYSPLMPLVCICLFLLALLLQRYTPAT